MTTWNPNTHPFIARWYSRSQRHGLYGWDSRTCTFETREAAEQAISEAFTAGTKRAEVVTADGPRFVILSRRKRGEPLRRIQ